MTFSFEISDKLRKILDKLIRKNPNLALAINKKIKQVVSSDRVAVEHFKNLKGTMSHLKRVHIGSFVLTFQFIGDTIVFEDFSHYDDAYQG